MGEPWAFGLRGGMNGPMRLAPWALLVAALLHHERGVLFLLEQLVSQLLISLIPISPLLSCVNFPLPPSVTSQVFQLLLWQLVQQLI